MDTVRREQVDATPGNHPDSPDQPATPSTGLRLPIHTPPTDELIDSIALEAIVIPPELNDAEEPHHAGSEDRLVAMHSANSARTKQIGPYEVSTWIGSGRVGNVYLATCNGELPRQVAVKLLPQTANKNTILNRFQNEIHIHAALAKHPNITALLEAGSTQDGQPYFTMDYIEGRRIDEYCDHLCLDIPTRLRLFAKVCTAIHFAHQYAMIHRNLKPSNILVTANGLPKVMDLGIAKLVQPDTGNENTTTSTSPTLTGTGELVLTPEYASPEQIKGEIVTTATDVYTLGVVLYVLLSGHWPYRITSQSTSDILWAICEQLPEKPSTAITRRPADGLNVSVAVSVSVPTALEELAMARAASPRRLKKLLSGDLDSIVMKALQKEPERRYASARHLGEDLNCYLSGMPVQARRDFPAYRPTKFIPRHAATVAAGFFFVLLFLTGVIALTRGLLTARRERDRIEESFHQARQVLDQIFTQITNERLLDQPVMHPLRTALLMDTQRFYEDFLTKQPIDQYLQPERAMAHTRIAKIISLTNSGVKAIAQYRQAITLWQDLVTKEPDNLKYQTNLAETLNDLGVILLPLEGRINEAMNMFGQAQEIVERLISGQPESISHRLQLGRSLLNIAETKEQQGKLDEAIMTIERVLEIESQVVAEYPHLLEPRVILATAHAALGSFLTQKPAEVLTAITNYQQAIELHKGMIRHQPQLIDQSYHLAVELSKLGALQQELGQPEPALQSLHQAIEIFERIAELCLDVVLCQEGSGTTYNMIGDLERKHGDRNEALAATQKAYKIFEHLLAENPQQASYRRNLSQSFNNLGRLQAQTGDSAIALRSFQRAIDLYESLHELSAKDSYNLACNIALCIPLITRKTALQSIPQEPSKGDRLRCQLYGDRALEALRRSFKGGFLTSQILQDETDLDSLRSRADFRALLKDIEEMPTMNGN